MMESPHTWTLKALADLPSKVSPSSPTTEANSYTSRSKAAVSSEGLPLRHVHQFHGLCNALSFRHEVYETGS